MFSMSEMFNHEKDECIEWTGRKNLQGYGTIYYNKKEWHVHRLIMALLNPEEFAKYPWVCHKCDNPSCVNYRHLYCGTRSDNLDDMLKNKGVPVKWRPEHRYI